MESYVLNGCAQWESILDAAGDIIVCSTGSYVLNGKLLCAQLDIIGVLNGKLCAQQEIIMCSTGHHWGAQWEVMCSTGIYNVLNWKLFGCSTGS